MSSIRLFEPGDPIRAMAFRVGLFVKVLWRWDERDFASGASGKTFPVFSIALRADHLVAAYITNLARLRSFILSMRFDSIHP